MEDEQRNTTFICYISVLCTLLFVQSKITAVPCYQHSIDEITHSPLWMSHLWPRYAFSYIYMYNKTWPYTIRRTVKWNSYRKYRVVTIDIGFENTRIMWASEHVCMWFVYYSIHEPLAMVYKYSNNSMYWFAFVARHSVFGVVNTCRMLSDNPTIWVDSDCDLWNVSPSKSKVFSIEFPFE